MQNYVNKAELALQEGQLVEAEMIIEEALLADPSHVKANYLFCLILLQTERLTEVISHIDKQREVGLPIEWVEPFEWIYEVAKQDVTQNLSQNTQSPNTELLQEWKEGLQDDSFKVQWETYEKMTGFQDEEVRAVLEEFLRSTQGDLVLKTKCLQQLRKDLNCDYQILVKKGEEQKTIEVNDVPVNREDWPEEQVAPILLLQQKVYDDPTLEQMAEELWIYFLEKHYPFVPQIEQPLKWTAALHFYTLKMVNEDIAESQLRDNFVEIYNISEAEIRERCQYFEYLLLIT